MSGCDSLLHGNATAYRNNKIKKNTSRPLSFLIHQIATRSTGSFI